MKYSEIKEIINLANQLDIDKTELFNYVNKQDESFELDNYKFITEQESLKEVINMHEGDPYILGCFNASFLCDYLPLDYDDIKTMQENESNFEILGKLVLNSGELENMMEEYIRLDGYGHALGSYDHSYDEITLNNIDYIYMRI